METNVPTELNSTLSSHILDTSIGKPAANVPVTLEKQEDDKWVTIASGLSSNIDGRIPGTSFPKLAGNSTYRITFQTEKYFRANQIENYFYPYVQVAFRIQPNQHYHVPLLISPFGYSTYRGS